MRNLIADDVCRCGNKNCNIKDNCARHRQLEINMPKRLWSFWYANFEKTDGESCQYFISIE